MKKVYFISGLGADRRSFGFLDLSYCEPHFIDWVAPAPTDTLEAYAEKLFASINDEKAVIVGLSFGGMLATEIAKKHASTKVILVASAKTYREIPFYLRFWRHFPIYKFNNNSIKNSAGPIVLNIIGAKGADQKKVQREIMKDADPAFLSWAMDVIVKWRNTVIPSNVTHIHGTADKLLPYRFVTADHTVKHGEHVMIMDHHAEISALLKKLIID